MTLLVQLVNFGDAVIKSSAKVRIKCRNAQLLVISSQLYHRSTILLAHCIVLPCEKKKKKNHFQVHYNLKVPTRKPPSKEHI